MHDLGLGPPVPVERHPDATHRGPCYDGVYGCHICHNAANNGAGTIGTCEWCKAENVPTRVTKAWDEPVMYAICSACIKSQNDELRRMSLGDDDDWYPEPEYNDDYEEWDDEGEASLEAVAAEEETSG